jgi:hypothetical protein
MSSFTRKKTEPETLHATNGLTPNKKIDNASTDEKCTIELEEKASLSGNTFIINGNDDKYKVEGVLSASTVLLNTNKMKIYKMDSEKLVAVVKRKRTSVRGVFSQHYQIFRPIPVNDGTTRETAVSGELASQTQAASDMVEDGQAMYRFATIEKQMTSLFKPKYIYHLYTKDNTKGELMLTLKRTSVLKGVRDADIRDKNDNLVAKVTNEAVRSWLTMGQADKYTLKIGANNDVLACTILTIVADTVSDRTPLSSVKHVLKAAPFKTFLQ